MTRSALLITAAVLTGCCYPKTGLDEKEKVIIYCEKTFYAPDPRPTDTTEPTNIVRYDI